MSKDFSSLDEVLVGIVEAFQGLKATECVCHLPPELFQDYTSPEIVERIQYLVDMGRIDEVEYSLPTMDWRVKSFLLPKGTGVRHVANVPEKPPSLGSQLKGIVEARKFSEHQEYSDAEYLQHQIIAFFSLQKVHISACVKTNRMVTSQKCPEFIVDEMIALERPILTHPDNPYYPIWQEFLQWCKSEELIPRLSVRWDGGGINPRVVLSIGLM